MADLQFCDMHNAYHYSHCFTCQYETEQYLSIKDNWILYCGEQIALSHDNRIYFKRTAVKWFGLSDVEIQAVKRYAEYNDLINA